MSFQHIELNRTFRKLTASEQIDDSLDYQNTAGTPVTWDELLQEHRVVILSEAGSGKTAEIRHITQQLRQQQKHAFFMRLEHIVEDFEFAFEEGTFEDFEQWLNGIEDGWFLLDSVDEARLRHPQDFEWAIRRFASRLTSSNLQRSHIIITSRGSAWRPSTDLMFCAKQLALSKPDLKKPEDAFYIVALDDLNLLHLPAFAQQFQISQIDQLIEDIERFEYQHMIARPEDLIELLNYWKAHQRLSNRQEMLEHSITSRLKERDQNRADNNPLSETDAWNGASLVAAVAMLTHQSTIRVPDGIHNQSGLDVLSILPDWNNNKCSALLSRPIFDEAIYETVRFHHRSVREYLTAKWFQQLLNQHTSRQKIEGLFFRQQYGIDVIVPNMRPILSWLMLWDNRLLQKAIQLSPEIIFECGEPQLLPVDYRRQAIHDVCDKMTSQVVRGLVQDYQKLQRFAASDLVDDIDALLQKYHQHDEVKYFLLLLIWQGKLLTLVPQAYTIATDQTCQRDTRIAAYHVITSLATPAQQQQLRQHFLQQSDELDRRELAELMDNLPATADSIDWLIACLAKVSRYQESLDYDHLPYALNKLIKKLDVAITTIFLQGIYPLFIQEPFIDLRYCQISKKYACLAQPISFCLEKIIQIKNIACLEKNNLSFLQKLATATPSYEFYSNQMDIDLKSLVSSWPELNLQLFWHEVDQKRKSNSDQRITRYYQANLLSSYWEFTSADFDNLIEQIPHQILIDDQLIILSILISFLDNIERYQRVERIKIAIKGNPALEAELNSFLNPSALALQQMIQNRKNQRYLKRSRIKKIRRIIHLIKARAYAKKNLHLLSPKNNSNSISKLQTYFLHRIRDQKNHDWGYGDWQSLQPFFGHDVAQAFHDGLVAYWRYHKAQLRSEGKSSNSTPYTTILGLTGLTIQAREEQNWSTNLTDDEVELAFRYAMSELNGFPIWFDTLYKNHSHQIANLFNTEISYDFNLEEKKFSYIISDLYHHPQFIHSTTTEHLFSLLETENPKDIARLEQSLAILLKTADTTRLSNLAQQNIQKNSQHLSLWFALWVSTKPLLSFNDLKTFIENLSSAQEKLDFCQNFIHYLIGGRFSNGQFFNPEIKNATFLKNLFLLMHQYIKKSDDINRSGGGVYSPTLRDHAQDARDSLFNILKNISGKETFLALKQLAAEYPEQADRPWMQHHALERAELDANQSAWTIQDVLGFQSSLDRAPSNGQELFELIKMRLDDLKHELEQGDSSIAKIIADGTNEETDLRIYIGDWMRKCAHGRYSVPQEEELANAARPDFRVHCAGLDLVLPIELKLAERWSGNQLFERLENQLAADYLRDNRSQCGIFLLVYKDKDRKKSWEINSKNLNFAELLYQSTKIC